MNRIILTKLFIEHFKKSAEYSTKSMASWCFKKQIQGNHDNYQTAIKLLNDLIECFEWFDISKVRLQYDENLVKDELEYYNKNKVKSMEDWTSEVLKYYGLRDIKHDVFDNDFMELHYNYKVEVFESEEMKEALLFDSDFSWGSIAIGYNKLLDITNCECYVEIRGEPFYEYPWGMNLPKLTLPTQLVDKNRKILKESMIKIQEKGFVLKYFDLPYPLTSGWRIDENGFY